MDSGPAPVFDLYGNLVAPRVAASSAPGVTAPPAVVPAAPVADLFAPVPLARFISETVAEPRWAVEGIWPEGASGIIAGRPKDGKSTLANELAITLWSSGLMFGQRAFRATGRPVSVLYVQQENADHRVQRDLQQTLAERGLGHIHEERYVTDGGEDATVSSFELDASALEYYGDDPRFEILSHKGFDLSNGQHRAWLWAYVRDGGFRYVFLDPLYMLIGVVDEKDSAPLKPILTWLTQLKNELGCAVILTHHMSDKGAPNEAASLLGSTYLHGWYEAALLTRRATGSVFTFKVDALRDLGAEAQYTLQGCGVGRWFYAEAAQGQTDSAGRDAPRVAAKETRKARLRELLDAHPDRTRDQLATELGVSTRTVDGYLAELRDGDDELQA